MYMYTCEHRFKKQTTVNKQNNSKNKGSNPPLSFSLNFDLKAVRFAISSYLFLKSSITYSSPLALYSVYSSSFTN